MKTYLVAFSCIIICTVFCIFSSCSTSRDSKNFPERKIDEKEFLKLIENNSYGQTKAMHKNNGVVEYMRRDFILKMTIVEKQTGVDSNQTALHTEEAKVSLSRDFEDNNWYFDANIFNHLMISSISFASSNLHQQWFGDSAKVKVRLLIPDIDTAYITTAKMYIDARDTMHRKLVHNIPEIRLLLPSQKSGHLH